MNHTPLDHTLVTEKTRVWVRVPGIYPYPTLTPDLPDLLIKIDCRYQIRNQHKILNKIRMKNTIKNFRKF